MLPGGAHKWGWRPVLVAPWPPPWQESSEQHTHFWLVWHLYLLVVKVSPSAGNPFISRFPSTGLAPLEGVTTYVYLPRYTGSHVTDHVLKGDLGTKELRAASPQTSQFPPYLSKELLISNGYFRLLPGREISHSRNDLGTRQGCLTENQRSTSCFCLARVKNGFHIFKGFWGRRGECQNNISWHTDITQNSNFTICK